MKKLLLGDFAVARGAYEGGVRVATAYPGTPSTEITEELSRYDDVYSEWAPNEKVALEVGFGASLAGARTIVSMKHVGLNVASDPLYTAAYTGVNAGLVVAVADDPSMFSSQNEQDTRLIARAANVPVIEPSDSAESKDFAKLAFEISEKYDTPVILRMTTRVAHSQGLVEIGEREELPLKPYERNIPKYVMMPANAKKRHIVVEERLNKLCEDSNEFAINRIESGSKDLGIICAGGVYQYCLVSRMPAGSPTTRAISRRMTRRPSNASPTPSRRPAEESCWWGPSTATRWSWPAAPSPTLVIWTPRG